MEAWQEELKKFCRKSGVTFRELSPEINIPASTMRRALEGDYSNKTKRKICNYLNIKDT